MRILFDNGTPYPLRRVLRGHDVATAYQRGWHNLQNGELLAKAEAAGFDAMITTDQNIRHQQNLSGRTLAVVVVLTTDWRRIRRHANLVTRAVDALAPGAYVEVAIPQP